MSKIGRVIAELERELATRYPAVLQTFAPGASDGQIADVASMVAGGRSLPADFIELYRWRNGGGEQQLWSDRTLLSLAAVAATYRELCEMHSTAFRPTWLPFVADTGGNFLCLDVEGAFGGQPGQIIDYDHEGLQTVRHGSLEDFLSTLLEMVKAGVLDTSDDANAVAADAIHDRLNPPRRHPLDHLSDELSQIAGDPQRVLRQTDPLVTTDAATGQVTWSADEPDWPVQWLGAREERRRRLLAFRSKAQIELAQAEEALATIACMEEVDHFQRLRTRMYRAEVLTALRRVDGAAVLLRDLLEAEPKPWERFDAEDRKRALVMLEELGRQSESAADATVEALRKAAEEFAGPEHRHAGQWLRYAEAESRPEQAEIARAKARELYETWYAAHAPTKATDFFNMAKNYLRLGDDAVVEKCLAQGMAIDAKTTAMLIKAEPLLARFRQHAAPAAKR